MKKPASSILVLLIFALVAGCSKKEEQAEEPQAEETEATPTETGKVLTSADGISQITVVGGWDKTSGLHKKAQLQASNPFKEMYIVVFTEKKDMYPGLTLQEYSKTTGKNLLKTLAAGSEMPAVQITLDGNNAIQTEIRGTTSGNSKITYIHTNVETPYYFHEILAWSPQAKFHANKYALENVVNSFKEVKAAPTTGGTSQP
ncbi:MAG TPA: hypothetical protein VLH08_04420 [Acidobacteriota bacterium]|nr:hypothetical protein [Acidobacteriota bacterium]